MQSACKKVPELQSEGTNNTDFFSLNFFYVESEIFLTNVTAQGESLKNPLILNWMNREHIQHVAHRVLLLSGIQEDWLNKSHNKKMNY